MPEPSHAADGQIVHPHVHYEKTDASLRAILIIMACALVLGGLIQGIVWVMFVNYSDQLDVSRQSRFPLAPTPSEALPPEPRLEQLDRLTGDEAANIRVRMRAKEKVLEAYGQTDEAGFVHIPIDTAIKRLAGRLPVRKEHPKGPRHDLGLVDSGESNSGRVFREEPR